MEASVVEGATSGDESARAFPVLDLRDVAVNLGGVKAVDGVSLTVERGRLYGLAGPNGSGKSTLLALISRLLDLTSGQILINGLDVGGRTPVEVARLGLARTFQTVRLLDEFTVLENVMLGGDQPVYGPGLLKAWLLPRWSRGREAVVRERAMEALDRLGLVDVRNERPLNLPYGTQRKVEIARTLAAQPNLILLDEPTAGMNRAERDEIGELLLQLRDEGVTQVLVEHDLRMMVDVCSDLYVLESGRLIGSGPPAACIREPQVVEAYLGKRGHAAS